jgi:hypothetical protein
VFGNLIPKATVDNIILPAVTMTWRKFYETVLPTALKIDACVKPTDSFGAIVTEAVDGSEPIIQWDRKDLRNPFSHYVYTYGSPASRWNLSPGWVEVMAISRKPSHWTQEPPNHPEGLRTVETKLGKSWKTFE